MSDPATLKPGLGAWQLWGIAVGLVISGEYFGWSYGWATAGTLGFLVTSLLVAVMYLCFIFSFTELTTAIPHAGGPYAYVSRAFGPWAGWMAGCATLIEFIFAPPAIALSIGAYLHVQFPWLPVRLTAIAAYLVFMGLNMLGVSIAASFELVVTLLAIAELLVFMGVVAPGFHWAHFSAGGWAGQAHFSLSGLGGILAAIPFAIWFFLAIEGAAMAAEETRDPHRNIPRAYLGGIATLLVLAFGVMLLAGGVGDWHALAEINDPLPAAMARVVGSHSGWLHMLVAVGLFGLVASFHGIIMGYSRQLFALARAGFLPAPLARLGRRTRTPHWAILCGGVIGIATLLSDRWLSFGGQPLTARVVTLSAFGAVIMYVLSMAALLRLRRIEPDLARPFRAPGYPWCPLIALGGAMICLATMLYFNAWLLGVLLAVFGLASLHYARWRRRLTLVLPDPESMDAAG